MLIFLAILLLAAVFTDWKSGKIPNLLISAGSIAGIFTVEDPRSHIVQALFIIIGFFPFYLMRALGAGDIKCIAMTALYLTPEQLLYSILYAFLMALIISFIRILCMKFRSQEKFSLRSITVHLAFPIFTGVLLSIGGNHL